MRVEFYDGVVSLSSHTRSELKMHCKEAVTLFLSFSILLFSLSLAVSLPCCVVIYIFLFLSVYILVLTQLIVDEAKEVQKIDRVVRSLVLPMQRGKTAASRVQ